MVTDLLSEYAFVKVSILSIILRRVRFAVQTFHRVSSAEHCGVTHAGVWRDRVMIAVQSGNHQSSSRFDMYDDVVIY